MHPIPSKLYKYRSINDYTKAILTRNELFFASPIMFNDPFDSAFQVLVEGRANQAVFEALAFGSIKEKLPHFSMQEALGAAREVGAAMLDRKKEELRAISIEKLAKDTNDKVGILALSERNDDILMWSHYADSHKGICVEFGTSQPSLLDAARPVRYADEFPVMELHDIVVDEDLRKSAPWILTKASQWEYEKEWRVLDFDGGRAGPKSFPPESLTGVILGCRISDKDRETVSSWLLTRRCEVPLFQAKEMAGHFRLKIEPILDLRKP